MNLELFVWKNTISLKSFLYCLGEYLSKFIPANGSGKVLALEVFSVLTYFQAIASIIAGGCDGTGAMTSAKKGENLRKKPTKLISIVTQYIFSNLLIPGHLSYWEWMN